MKKLKESEIVNFFTSDVWFDTFFTDAYEIDENKEYAEIYASHIPCDVEYLRKETREFLDKIKDFKKTPIYNDFKNEQLLWVNAFYQNLKDCDVNDENIRGIKEYFKSKDGLRGFLSSSEVAAYLDTVADIDTFAKIAQEIFGIKRETDIKKLCKKFDTPCLLTGLEKAYMEFNHAMEEFYKPLKFLNAENDAELLAFFSFINYRYEYNDKFERTYILSPLSNSIAESIHYKDVNEAFANKEKRDEMIKILSSSKFDVVMEKFRYLDDTKNMSEILNVMLNLNWKEKDVLNGKFLVFLNNLRSEVNTGLFNEIVSEFLANKMLEKDEIYQYITQVSTGNNCLDGVEIAKRYYINKLLNFEGDLVDNIQDVSAIRVLKIDNIEKLKGFLGHGISNMMQKISSSNFEVKYEEGKNEIEIVMKGNSLDLITVNDINSYLLKRIKRIVKLDIEIKKNGKGYQTKEDLLQVNNEFDNDFREFVLNLQLSKMEGIDKKISRRNKI